MRAVNLIQDLISRTLKELIHHNNKKVNNPAKSEKGY